jgi:hypothetical protein
LFYFAGNGSLDEDGAPTLVSADGRQAQVFDIKLTELANLATSPGLDLVTIIDAGWTRSTGPAESSRVAPSDTREPA